MPRSPPPLNLPPARVDPAKPRPMSPKTKTGPSPQSPRSPNAPSGQIVASRGAGSPSPPRSPPSPSTSSPRKQSAKLVRQGSSLMQQVVKRQAEQALEREGSRSPLTSPSLDGEDAVSDLPGLEDFPPVTNRPRRSSSVMSNASLASLPEERELEVDELALTIGERLSFQLARANALALELEEVEEGGSAPTLSAEEIQALESMGEDPPSPLREGNLLSLKLPSLSGDDGDVTSSEASSQQHPAPRVVRQPEGAMVGPGGRKLVRQNTLPENFAPERRVMLKFQATDSYGSLDEVVTPLLPTPVNTPAAMERRVTGGVSPRALSDRMEELREPDLTSLQVSKDLPALGRPNDPVVPVTPLTPEMAASPHHARHQMEEEEERAEAAAAAAIRMQRGVSVGSSSASSALTFPDPDKYEKYERALFRTTSAGTLPSTPGSESGEGTPSSVSSVFQRPHRASSVTSARRVSLSLVPDQMPGPEALPSPLGPEPAKLKGCMKHGKHVYLSGSELVDWLEFEAEGINIYALEQGLEVGPIPLEDAVTSASLLRKVKHIDEAAELKGLLDYFEVMTLLAMSEDMEDKKSELADRYRRPEDFNGYLSYAEFLFANGTSEDMGSRKRIAEQLNPAMIPGVKRAANRAKQAVKHNPYKELTTFVPKYNGFNKDDPQEPNTNVDVNGKLISAFGPPGSTESAMLISASQHPQWSKRTS